MRRILFLIILIFISFSVLFAVKICPNKKCPNYGKEYPDEFKFCPQCGTRLVEREENVIWRDDFETYSAGDWPSPNWIDDGNVGGYVTNSVAHSGSQSLRVYGVVGVFWGELAHRAIGTSAPWIIECYIRNGNEPIPGSGHQNRGSLSLHKQPAWQSDGRGLLAFHKDGHIRGYGDIDLGSYQTLTWYKVKIKYEYPVSGQVRITYWINDRQVGQIIDTPKSYESDLAYISLGVGAGTAWFDDAKIIKIRE